MIQEIIGFQSIQIQSAIAQEHVEEHVEEWGL